MSADFQLFTSLRKDEALEGTPEHGPDHAGWNKTNKSSIYMLDYHRDRMLRAATHWKWAAAVDVLQGDDGLLRLAEFIDSSTAEKGSPLRVKVLVAQDGQLACESSLVPAVPSQNLFPRRLPPPDAAAAEGGPLKENTFKVLPDGEPTSRSEYTHYKTTKRAMYDGARGRLGISLTDKKEVLLVNRDDGSIMEGSLTTPWFWRDGRWVTPPVPAVFSLDRGSGGQDGTTRRWALENGLAVEEAVHVDSLVDGEECWISNGVRGFIHGKVCLPPKQP
ncbi:aminodeoxychorismate lyase [Plectosphaerella cucumerina]|uniref:Aminodeoxychorismate lyase n=1 Tax=Plectosphaerella cucumerina TaxID=40658 RepID=A0A8K0TCZ8_9PEZI|nr:aminodeoxychorismate lyase [Plectosphaerella cucumerina]